MEFKCPICRKLIKPAPARDKNGKFFPFCSERCKLVDLGAWLDTDYKIQVDQFEQNVEDADVNNK